MPTVLFINGIRFFFYSNESKEPAHIHMEKGNAEGKIWLEPEFGIVYMHGFTSAEQKEIPAIVKNNLEQFKKKWNEYFSK